MYVWCTVICAVRYDGNTGGQTTTAANRHERAVSGPRNPVVAARRRRCRRTVERARSGEEKRPRSVDVAVAGRRGFEKRTRPRCAHIHTPYQMTSAVAVAATFVGGSWWFSMGTWAGARGVLCAQYRGKTTPPRSTAVAYSPPVITPPPHGSGFCVLVACGRTYAQRRRHTGLYIYVQHAVPCSRQRYYNNVTYNDIIILGCSASTFLAENSAPIYFFTEEKYFFFFKLVATRPPPCDKQRTSILYSRGIYRRV